MNGLARQRAYEDAVMARQPEPLPLDLEAWLGTLNDGSLAYVANRVLQMAPIRTADGEKRWHGWRDRHQAVGAMLHWESEKRLAEREDRLAHDMLVRWMQVDLRRWREHGQWPEATIDAASRLVAVGGPDTEEPLAEDVVFAVDFDPPEVDV